MSVKCLHLFLHWVKLFRIDRPFIRIFFCYKSYYPLLRIDLSHTDKSLTVVGYLVDVFSRFSCLFIYDDFLKDFHLVFRNKWEVVYKSWSSNAVRLRLSKAKQVILILLSLLCFQLLILRSLTRWATPRRWIWRRKRATSSTRREARPWPPSQTQTGKTLFDFVFCRLFNARFRGFSNLFMFLLSVNLRNN